ncbi:MAG TPA: FMN-binding protein [Acidimicrobiales bacterium]|nr:FMN-binding protein [Acidimicrobiales bacterium]
MKRAVVVAAATVAGLAGVLSFHTKPATLRLGKPLAPQPRARPATTARTRPASSPTSAAPAPVPRTATGAAVNYNYGVLSVAATVSGTKLTNVSIASIDDGGNFRSQSIDQQALPVLEQEALAAQSANIQGVSGASYTSAGFEQSLQSALSQLGFK